MKKGNAPIGVDGNFVNLHHIIGKEPGPMIELFGDTHRNFTKQLHNIVEDGRSFRRNSDLKKGYEKFRKQYWKNRAKDFE